MAKKIFESDILVKGTIAVVGGLTSEFLKANGDRDPSVYQPLITSASPIVLESSRNLVSNIHYNPATTGYQYTYGIQLGVNQSYRFGFGRAFHGQANPIQSAGYYSVSFWYKVENYISGSVVGVDINDVVCTDLDVSSNKGWTFYSGTVYVNTLLGAWGFLDIEGNHGSTITLSDISVTRSGKPSQQYTPAPEDTLIYATDNTLQTISGLGVAGNIQPGFKLDVHGLSVFRGESYVLGDFHANRIWMTNDAFQILSPNYYGLGIGTGIDSSFMNFPGTSGVLFNSGGGLRLKFAPTTGNVLINTDTDDGVHRLQIAGELKTQRISFDNSGGAIGFNRRVFDGLIYDPGFAGFQLSQIANTLHFQHYGAGNFNFTGSTTFASAVEVNGSVRSNTNYFAVGDNKGYFIGTFEGYESGIYSAFGILRLRNAGSDWTTLSSVGNLRHNSTASIQGDTVIGDTTSYGYKFRVNGNSNFAGTVVLENNTDLIFQDHSGNYPTSGKGFIWSLNNDFAKIYALQPGNDQIDLVFNIGDNVDNTSRYVFKINSWSGVADDRYPLIIRGLEFDLKDSSLWSNGVQRMSNSGVLTNISGNISQFTNNSGYLTSYSETDTLQSVMSRGGGTNVTIETISTSPLLLSPPGQKRFLYHRPESNIDVLMIIPSVSIDSNDWNWSNSFTFNTNGGLYANTFHGNLNGNATSVTNGVYTIGSQTINGNKTFNNNILLADAVFLRGYANSLTPIFQWSRTDDTYSSSFSYNGAGQFISTANITAPTFIGNLNGNADTSTSVIGLTITNGTVGINPADTIKNQIGYASGVSLFGFGDGGLHTSALDSEWQHQIFGDFRSGQIAIRGKQYNNWQAWRTVIDSSNVGTYALPISGGQINTDGYIDFLNSTWGEKLRIGGNGHTSNENASIVTTNGNLHIDSSLGKATCINYYSGSLIIFGNNGYGGSSAEMDNSGQFWKGAIGTGQKYLYESGTWGIDISGTSSNSELLSNKSYSFIKNKIESRVFWGGSNRVSESTLPLDTLFNKLIIIDKINGSNSLSIGPASLLTISSADSNVEDSHSPNWGGSVNQLAFIEGSNRLYLRSGQLGTSLSTVWNPFVEILSSSNYQNFSPTFTGTGASGTWDINVTGSSGNSSKFMSTSHAGSFWLVNNWSGTYWDITSNHGADVQVGRSILSENSNKLNGQAFTNGSDGWFRSIGDAGWYNETYGVGIRASAIGVVRTSHGSSFVSEGSITANGNLNLSNESYIRGNSNVLTPIFQWSRTDDTASASFSYDGWGLFVSNTSITAPTFIGNLNGNASTVSNGLYATGSQNFNGRLIMWSNDTSGTYNSRSIELREVGQVGAAQSAPAYAPSIGFHWGGRAQCQVFMRENAVLAYRTDEGNGFALLTENNYESYIPSANIYNKGLVSTISQTFAGIKSFNDTPVFSSGSIEIYDSAADGKSSILVSDAYLYVIDCNNRNTLTTWQGGITIYKENSKFCNLLVDNLSGNRNIYLPNNSGTLALTSDLSSYAPLNGSGTSGTWGINISGTSANSALFNNKPETNFIYGNSTSGQNGAQTSGVSISTDYTQWHSGFWDVSGADWTPDTNWYWGITASHRSNGPSYNYSAQQIYNIDGTESYFRTIDGGNPQPWRRILHSNNFNQFSPTLTGAGASGNWSINASTATKISNQGTVTLATSVEHNEMYASQPSYSNGYPVKLLNFQWYLDVWSIGNIRGTGTNSLGLGTYLNGTEKLRVTTSGITVSGNINATNRVELSKDSASIAENSGFWMGYCQNGRVSLGALGSGNGYGIFYYQGTAGRDGIDSIDLAFGTTTSVNSSHSFKTNGDYKLSGTLSAVGDVIAYSSSDRRFKDNIKPIENAMDKIAKIGGYEFDWNENQDVYKGHDVGVIAQEVEAVLPEVVTTRDNGYKAVKYEKIVSLLIQGIKEQQKEINQLKRIINNKN